jgi:hypothetical protein
MLGFLMSTQPTYLSVDHVGFLNVNPTYLFMIMLGFLMSTQPTYLSVDHVGFPNVNPTYLFIC